MIFEASRLTVLAMTAPQPSWKALAITFRLVPGGPDAMMNGLGRFNPSTVVARVGIFLFPSLLQREIRILRRFGGNFKGALWRRRPCRVLPAPLYPSAYRNRPRGRPPWHIPLLI